MTTQKKYAVIGAGLAGSEASWQLASFGLEVDLYEMRPKKNTEAHNTSLPAELVCSNSLKSLDTANAHGLLKEEIRLMGSLVIEKALEAKVPAGSALAVDKEVFGQKIKAALDAHPKIHWIEQEITEIRPLLAEYEAVILATGPLTADSLFADLKDLMGEEDLYFYDAIAPIVHKESIDFEKAYYMSRYGKGTADYINCPMNHEQYETLIEDLISSEKVEFKDFEKAQHFEGCLPIEVMAQRGPQTLSFGPMKPVGLEKEGERRSYAVLQLRQEDSAGTLYNMVGCQTRMTYPEQKRVFRKIPGLENAEFARLGSMHRNSFLNAPKLLSKDLSAKVAPNLFVAGQISGVEGYVESTAMGLWAAWQVVAQAQGKPALEADKHTMLGALASYLADASVDGFQPMNANFGLMFPLDSPFAPRVEGQRKVKLKKKEKRVILAEIALERIQKLILEFKNLDTIE